MPIFVIAVALAISSLGIALRFRDGLGLRALARFCMALGFGLVLGTGAVLSTKVSLPPEELLRFIPKSLSGIASIDSRRTASGSTLVTVRVAEASFFTGRMTGTLKMRFDSPVVFVVAEPGPPVYAGFPVEAAGLSAIDAAKGLFFAKSLQLGAPGGNRPAPRLLARARAVAVAGFSDGIAAVSGKAFPLAQALLIGIRDEIDAEESALFRNAGCAHILSLSGQHLSILCMLMTLVFEKALKRKRLAKRASLVFASGFTWLAGAGPSLLRSALSLGVGMVFERVDRPQRGIGLLSSVFCLAVALRPGDAASLSFILSYAAMAGLAILSPRWQILLWRVPKFISAPLSASLAALCATAPISLGVFGRLPTGGILAATLSGPLVLVFMWSLLAGTLVGAALPIAAPLLSRWHELLHQAIIWVMQAGASLPVLKPAGLVGKCLLAAAIVAVSLLVYAYPYIEDAFYQGKNDDTLRFPLGT
jgi:ComEC/Rec2-related protein